MYRTVVQRIGKKHPLYQWADDFAHSETNFQNATIFRIRNLCTGLAKNQQERHELEQQVIDEFVSTYNMLSDPKWKIPEPNRWIPAFSALDDVFKITKNPDYYSKSYCVKSAQKSIKQTLDNFNAFFESLKSYKNNPEKFSGRPEMPKYKKKGGVSTFTIDNQDGKIYHDNRGKTELKLPKTKERLKLGKFIPKDWEFVHAKVKPDGEDYLFCVVFDDGKEEPNIDFESRRIAAGDLGVDNLIACVSNTEAPSLIIGGGVLKSENQLYNKEMARIQSEQTKGGEEKFEMTDEAWRITHHRADKMRDFFHKSAVIILNWCVENRIDTFVLGMNRHWKENVHMKHEAKQTFVQIPFAQFAAILKNKLEREGIKFVEQEESYTSQASCLDEDFIPIFGEEKPKGGWKFSGYRSPMTKYYRDDGAGNFVEYKVKPRGLYKSRRQGEINSDLNGAVNILRKAFSQAFEDGIGIMPELQEKSKVLIIKHPDDVLSGVLLKSNSDKQPSLSKARRVARKSGFVDERGCAYLTSFDVNFTKRSPTGIELCG